MAKKKSRRKPDPDQLLTVKEAAALLGISVVSLWRLSDLGHLKTQRIKGMKRLRFRRSDVLRMNVTE